MHANRTRTLLALSIAAATGAVAMSASADELTIEEPGDHPDYTAELEPHLLLGLIDPPGPGGGQGIGFGFRGTFEIVDNGFVPTINNTIGVGVGLDILDYAHSENCERRDKQSEWVCKDDKSTYVWVPVVMQWNFWLSRDWSVFGEPGLAVRLSGPGDDRIDPLVFYAGGRWHFSDYATLTMRLGYPSFSAGVSFLL